MYTRSKIIILSTIKYADADLIVKCFSKELGKLSFLVKGARRSGKKKTGMSYFLPFNILWATFQYRENKNLLYFKEINIDLPLTHIHQDIRKSSIVFLLTEVVENAIQEEEVNENMFSYLENAIYWLDTHESTQNFHIAFLVGFSRYLGIYPELYHLNENIEKDTFDAQLKFDPKNIDRLEQVLNQGIDITTSHQFKLDKKEKLGILNILMLYYRTMIPDFNVPRSYAVVKDIFA